MLFLTMIVAYSKFILEFHHQHKQNLESSTSKQKYLFCTSAFFLKWYYIRIYAIF